MTHHESPFDLKLALTIAEGAARTAGALIRKAYYLPRTIRDKGVNDLVTETDVASERTIVGILRNAFPNHNITAEEAGQHVNEFPGAPTWWVDPLDGTYNFVHAVPRFSVSIGCVDADKNVLVGVVYDPMFDECFCAVRGSGATCNGEPIAVSKAATLRESLAASGFAPDLRKTNNNRAEWSAFVERCQGMARMGSAAMDMCYVACGRFDLYWEYGPTAIDRSAGTLIVQEAGGKVTDCAGNPFDVIQAPCVLASNGRVHDEAVSVLIAARQSVGETR